MQAAGLQPRTVLAIDEAAPGTVVRTVPAAGDPAPSGGRVRIVVSAGFPRLAYEGGAELVTADGAEGRAVTAVLPREIVGTKPSWTPDGRAVVARYEGGLVIASTSSPGQPTRLELSRAGDDLDEPSVAEGTQGPVLAFVSHDPELGDRVCFSRLSGTEASQPSCRRLAGWRLGELTWMPNGRALLAAAKPVNGADWRFGLLRLRTDTPFSTYAGEWRGGRSLRTPAQPRRGVAAVAVDPSGRRLAVVTSHATSRFQIALAAPDDLALEHARVLPLQGCDVEWRPDGAELAVVQSDNGCTNTRSRIVRVAPARPRELQTVVLRGRDPAWQPIELGTDQPCTSTCPGYTTMIGDGGTPSVMPVSVAQVHRLAADEDVERPRARKRRHHGGARLRRGRRRLGAAHDRRADHVGHAHHGSSADGHDPLARDEHDRSRRGRTSPGPVK